MATSSRSTELHKVLNRRWLFIIWLHPSSSTQHRKGQQPLQILILTNCKPPPPPGKIWSQRAATDNFIMPSPYILLYFRRTMNVEVVEWDDENNSTGVLKRRDPLVLWRRGGGSKWRRQTNRQGNTMLHNGRRQYKRSLLHYLVLNLASNISQNELLAIDFKFFLRDEVRLCTYSRVVWVWVWASCRGINSLCREVKSGKRGGGQGART